MSLFRVIQRHGGLDAVQTDSEEPRLSAEQKGKQKADAPATTTSSGVPSPPSTLHPEESTPISQKTGKLSARGSNINTEAHGAHNKVVSSGMKRDHDDGNPSAYSKQSHAAAIHGEPKRKRAKTLPNESPLGTYASSQRSREVFEKQMKPKALGYPLWAPATGLSIGDVGIISANGTFDKLFNICAASELPHYFFPLHPPLSVLDVRRFQDFNPNSYIASASIEQIREGSAAADLAFRLSGSEGAILVLPLGALREELINLLKFREFISSNADNWARLIRDLKGERNDGFELRLITGTLTTQAWGIAAFSDNTKPDSVLEFRKGEGSPGDSVHTWGTRGSSNVRVSSASGSSTRKTGPTTYCVAFNSFTVSCNSETVSSVQNIEGNPECRSILRHPCSAINERLLSKNANANRKIVASHDRDWCAVLTEKDEEFPNEGDLLDRVFEFNEEFIEDGVGFLRWKGGNSRERAPQDILKEVDVLRDSLTSSNTPLQRADILHSITDNILTFLHASDSRNTPHSNFLLSSAMSNVAEEVDILSTLKQIRPSTLHLFASTLWTRYETTGEVKVLDQAISSFKKALDLDSRHTDSMSGLAASLWARFNQYGQINDLEEVIVLYRTLLFSRAVNNMHTLKWLNGIGLALWARYKRSNKAEDMNQAVDYLRRASISYPIPCDCFTLSNLGNILVARSRSHRDLNDLNEAIFYYRSALESVSPLHPHRSAFLSNLADALSYRFSRVDDISDLNEAIRTYERVLELPAPHHRDRPTCAMTFADALQSRFKKLRDLEDLALAVKKYREAKQLSSPAHPKYAMLLEKLLLAEKQLRDLNISSPSPPPSTMTSPTLYEARPPSSRSDCSLPSKRKGHTVVPPFSPKKKYRVVSGASSTKPYIRRQDSSASASDSESNASTLVRPSHPSKPSRLHQCSRALHSLEHVP